MRLGVDTGGTFTDFVLVDENADAGQRLRTHKVLSTPEAPERAILQGMVELGLADAVAAGKVQIVHGTTVATNAALEGKGVRTAFITNRGFADLLTIGRQTRRHLYRLYQAPLPPPVEPALCLETGGRTDARGQTLIPLTDDDLAELATQLNQLQPAAVAISLLFSFLDSSAEQRIASYLQENLVNHPFICHSSAVLPEYREYERGIATWLNASLGPLMERYLLTLRAASAPSPLSVMQSSGGTISAQQASRSAVNLLLSGPAGGLAAIDWLAHATGEQRFITFDMGGTSTDVALYDGRLTLTSEGNIGPWPVAVPMLDMHTIGAGGGSLAWIDTGGLLQVGPASAGARPGPACYGLGGTQTTVTDANLLLGRLPEGLLKGSNIHLDKSKTLQAMQDLSKQLGLTDFNSADGIIRLVNEHMAQALRAISVARGHDPKEFRLCCFGGAGGLHVCALADELGMTKALVPVHAGVLSALGMLAAPAQRHFSRTWQQALEVLDHDGLDNALAAMLAEGRRELIAEGHHEDSIGSRITADLRYQGQSASLNVSWHDPQQAETAFITQHAHRYGHSLPAKIELVNIRLALSVVVALPMLPAAPEGPAALPVAQTRLYGHAEPVPVYLREQLVARQKIRGPALITEANATTLLETGWEASVDTVGHLLLLKNSN